jgi:hypothetical protein
MRKSDEDEMVATARELYKFCSMTENKATCDKYKSGDCPYWRVYIHHGQYAYNSMSDGLEECSCTTPDSDGNLPPHCVRSVAYGPISGHSVKPSCSYCQDAGCIGTYNQQKAGVNMTGSADDLENCWPGYLRYNGLKQRMPDTPENHGCDGADSTYNVKCDWWFVYTNCKDLEDGKELTGIDEAKRPHFETEITVQQCKSGIVSQWVLAMKKYLASQDYLDDFPPPTPAPTTPAPPTPAPTAAPATPAPTEAPVSEESYCRLEAMAALTVWLTSVLQ